VIRALHRDGAVAVQPMMDVDASLGVMHVAHPATGTGANHTSVGGAALAAPPGRTGSKARRPGIIDGSAAGPLLEIARPIDAGAAGRSWAIGRRTIYSWMVGRGSYTSFRCRCFRQALQQAPQVWRQAPVQPAWQAEAAQASCCPRLPCRQSPGTRQEL
jgi:hypothetical protein